MTNILTNQELRSILRDRMEAAGMPIERVPGGHAANQLYRITAGTNAEKTVRLRTNRDYAVMALAEGPDYAAVISSLEDIDLVAIACVNPSGEAECYLVPASRLNEDMKAGHRAASGRLNRPSNSNVRILYFRYRVDRPWHGYARKYAEFRLGPAVEAQPSTTSQDGGVRRGSDVIERAQRMIAAEFGVPPTAVRISIDLVGRPSTDDENRPSA
jgi:hypothetical protein